MGGMLTIGRGYLNAAKTGCPCEPPIGIALAERTGGGVGIHHAKVERLSPKYLFILVEREGLEPSTPAL